jgi:hypothetical protein
LAAVANFFNTPEDEPNSADPTAAHEPLVKFFGQVDLGLNREDESLSWAFELVFSVLT